MRVFRLFTSFILFDLPLLLVLLLLIAISTTTTNALSSSSTTTNSNSNVIDNIHNIKAAVLVPGFLTGAKEFEEMCDILTNEYGIPTVAVPMPNWHWLPCLGGRSARPMLERIDCTVQQLIAADGDTTQIGSQLFDYSLSDLWEDFQNNPGGVMNAGGTNGDVDSYPVVQPRGKFPLPSDTTTTKKKIALIGHSAGGWIARAYLSDRNYGGKVYDGKRYIHSLVTLGTPNIDAPGPAFDGIRWVNRDDASSKVPSLAVGGTGFKGTDWGSLTEGSYTFCSSDGSDGSGFTGDGVTPIQSSLGLKGADETLELPGVHHFCWNDVFGGSFVSPELTKDHREGAPWYGSKQIIPKWSHFISSRTTSANK